MSSYGVTKPQWVNAGGTILALEVNTMPDDALAPKVAKASAGMILAVYSV